MKLLTVIFIFLAVFLFCTSLGAQEVLNPSSRVQALAGASVGLSGCWSVFGNQAGMANTDQFHFGGSFLNQYLVSELSTRAGFIAFPIQSSVFAVSLYQFGKSPFRREKYGLAYARHLSKKLSFGMQFNYYRLLFPEENRMTGCSGLELGIQYFPSENLILGVHITNPYSAKIITYSGNYKYESLVKVGALYYLSESFNITTEIENEVDSHLTVRTGMEYNISNRIFIRGGVSGHPYQCSAGFGFQAEKLKIDIANSYHQYLGSSPSVSFQFQIK